MHRNALDQHDTEPEDTPDDVQQITLRLLDSAFGGGEAYWKRHRPELRRRGLINKMGRKDFGSLRRIRRALITERWSQ